MSVNGRFKKVVTTDNFEMEVDTADVVCQRRGFKAEEVALSPKGDIVTLKGVAPRYGMDWKPVLWYVIHHPSIKGRACCWGGKEQNLLKAGFTRISA